MSFEEFQGLVKCFKMAFNKAYDEQELRFMYRYFKEYSPKVFTKVVDRIVESYDKMPSLKQMIDVCEQTRLSVELREAYEEMPPPTEQDKKEFQEVLDSFK